VKPRFKTTAADYRLFVRTVAHYVKLYRLTRWRIETVHEDYEGTRAWIQASTLNHTATIGLSVDWKDDPVTTAHVHRAARHEVIHIILDPLNEVAAARYLTYDQKKQALESTVRYLEDMLPK